MKNMEKQRLVTGANGGKGKERPDAASPTRSSHCLFSADVLVWVLCGLFIIAYTTLIVTMPMYARSTKKAGGGPYDMLLFLVLMAPILLAIVTLLYKCFCDVSAPLIPHSPWWVTWLGGVLYALTGVGVMVSALPGRTPPHLQGILVTLRIPYAVIVRFLWLRKGLSVRRFVCTVIILIGIFITLEPQIWSLSGARDPTAEAADSSGGSSVVWSIVFGLSYLPLSVMAVLCERELKQKDAHSLSFITWTQVFQVLMIVPLFWLDILPFFGTASSLAEALDHMRRQMACHFSCSESCHGLAVTGWVYILAYCLANLFQFLLIQRAEGAVFAMIVQSMVTPLATLFWTVFRMDRHGDGLHWQPEWTVTTSFTVGGLLIIVPAVVMYNVFSRGEVGEEKEQTAEPPAVELTDRQSAVQMRAK